MFSSFIKSFIPLFICVIVVSFLLLSALSVFISCFSSFISLLVCVIVVSFLLLSVFKVFTEEEIISDLKKELQIQTIDMKPTLI